MWGVIVMIFKKFEDLTFSDHYMFEKVLQNEEICKELLERLLKIKIDYLVYPEIEKTISPYYETKGVRLDVYVKDSDKVFDIELQNALDMDLPFRTRYYQSMVDTDSLLKGEHYSKLPESFVIFICTYDPFNKNFPIYTFENRCLEDLNVSLKDKTIKKFFNAKAYEQEKDVAIKSFLRYINSREVSDDFTDRIEAFIKDIKSKEVNRKEYSTVNIHDQDIYFKARNEGICQGAKEKAIETAKNLLSMNLSIENISKATGLSEEEIKNLQ
jgi:predicted transposase/invertase (TIGR01784 family)